MSGEFVSRSAVEVRAALESARWRAFEEIVIREWRRHLVEARGAQDVRREEKAS